MTNNEAAKWIQIFIDEMNRDLIEELGLCLSEKTQKMMKAIEMGRDALTAQPETHEERTETHACDLISRQEAVECDGFREVERDDERRSN